MSLSVENVSNTRDAGGSRAVVAAEAPFFLPTVTFCVGFVPVWEVWLLSWPLVSSRSSSVSQFPYLLTFSALLLPIKTDVVLPRRADLALTWILQQSLNTFHASCKIWQGEHQRHANPASCCSCRRWLRKRRMYFFTFFFSLKFELDDYQV